MQHRMKLLSDLAKSMCRLEWPLMSKRKHLAEMKRERDMHRKVFESQEKHMITVLRNHRVAMDECRDAVSRLVEKMSRIDWSEPDESGTYQMMMSFDSRMIQYGCPDKRSLEIVADVMASQVRKEIECTKFVTPRRRQW